MRKPATKSQGGTRKTGVTAKRRGPGRPPKSASERFVTDLALDLKQEARRLDAEARNNVRMAKELRRVALMLNPPKDGAS